MDNPREILETYVSSFYDGNVSPMHLAEIIKTASICFQQNQLSVAQYRSILFHITSCIDGRRSIKYMHESAKNIRKAIADD